MTSRLPARLLARAGAEVHRRASIAFLVLDDGRAVNVLSSDRMEALTELLLRTFELSPALAGLVIEGNGRGSFAAGADLGEIARLDAEAALRLSRRGERLMQRIEEAPCGVVALVDGHALGGGFDLAMSCDVTVATPESIFGHPGIARGFFTGWGGTRRIPTSGAGVRGYAALLTGDRLSAADASRAGLIAAVLPWGAAHAHAEHILEIWNRWTSGSRHGWRAARGGGFGRDRGLARALFGLGSLGERDDTNEGSLCVDTPLGGC